MTSNLWPALNASLNATSAVFLALGAAFIFKKNVSAHRFCMGTAFLISALFLLSYLAYHFQVGATRFSGTGWIRPVYFTILISHTLLAVLIVPLIFMTFRRALKGQFEAHRRLARWTWPLWMYVSLTGVVIYFLLYHV